MDISLSSETGGLVDVKLLLWLKKTVSSIFVEVKYIKHSYQGVGLDYITPNKLEQMLFVVELWVLYNAWQKNYKLSALELEIKKSGD